MCRTGAERDELIYQRGLVHHARHLHPKSQGRIKLLKLSSVLAKQTMLRPDNLHDRRSVSVDLVRRSAQSGSIKDAASMMAGADARSARLLQARDEWLQHPPLWHAQVATRYSQPALAKPRPLAA